MSRRGSHTSSEQHWLWVLVPSELPTRFEALNKSVCIIPHFLLVEKVVMLISFFFSFKFLFIFICECVSLALMSVHRFHTVCGGQKRLLDLLELELLMIVSHRVGAEN